MVKNLLLMRVKMALYILIHKWKKENLKAVARKVIEAMSQLPEETIMCSSYINADQTGAWCVWETKSDKQLVDYMKNGT